MSTTGHTIIGLDQGTTSTRAVQYDLEGCALRKSQKAVTQYYPEPAWVEHDALQIWQQARDVLEDVIDDSVKAIGISNQRETIVLWDRQTNQPLSRAIVWQDRRTASDCERLKALDGVNDKIRTKTGLLIDPFFSATKLSWLLENIPDARERAERGELAAGTIDSWLLWNLTQGKVHATDVTNASRTLLFNVHTFSWDAELLELFNIPLSLLPRIRDNDAIFGRTDSSLFGNRRILIAGSAGDQQAAAIGQACFHRGDVKISFGTGCFLLANTGTRLPEMGPESRLLSTVAWRLRGQGTYAIEGSMFVAGAAITWLKDKMGLVETTESTWDIAATVPDDHGVYLVPGFVGLGAPYWRPDVRGMITGLTLNSSAADLVRATLESVAFQTRDLVEVISAAFGPEGLDPLVRVVGGMSSNGWFIQFLADLLDEPLVRPAAYESSARGAAYLAALATGLYADLDDIVKVHMKQECNQFTPNMSPDVRERLLQGWRHAITQALT